MRTVRAPIVLSKRSAKPCSDATFKVPIVFSQVLATSLTSGALKKSLSSGAVTTALRCCVTPFVSRNARVILTTFWSRQCMTRRLVSVATATIVASRFSSAAYFINSSTCSGATTTAIRSCDSEIANSVPSRPSYFLGTLSRLMSRPSVNSPIATDTPPAPKSLQRLIRTVTS